MGGWLVISYFFIARPVRYLNELVDAAEKLARPGEDPIVLSAAMKETEAQLNLFRERALRDAMAAREAEQRKNDLIVYLAHDLKTPLTSVIGYLTLLRDEPDLSSALRERYTGIALDKAERLEELINEFFDITRFDLTHLELEKRPVDLARMLQQVASEFAPMLEEAGLTCRLSLPESLPYPCDPDKLARVFDNLLRNACHYSTAGTEVRIAAEQREEGLSLTFANTGITIPPEKLSRIFEQFFRLDSSRASKTGGAGLGLAIAKEIVQLHGGTITAQSEDGVTTVTVCLPDL
ncbi:MAG: HAMP domain-containing histidine kinase [Lawsonibacter sp.]|nr:HAMP domain-containing histidine kinase [Lawsonibacter sp.]